jgi:hypothetical protein
VLPERQHQSLPQFLSPTGKEFKQDAKDVVKIIAKFIKKISSITGYKWG